MTTAPKPQFKAGELNVYSAPRDVSAAVQFVVKNTIQGNAVP